MGRERAPLSVTIRSRSPIPLRGAIAIRRTAPEDRSPSRARRGPDVRAGATRSLGFPGLVGLAADEWDPDGRVRVAVPTRAIDAADSPNDTFPR